MKFFIKIIRFFGILILFFPILLLIILISLFVVIIDGRPIFFKQNRLGINKTIFEIYKFRTMSVNSEKSGTGLFSYKDDPRVTKLGMILRKFSLDELPQFFNIVRGDMNFIGPRPAVEYELGDPAKFDDFINKRFIIKPGVTGYSQVNGRNLLNWDQKIKLDNQYIDLFNKYGIFIDISILIKTAYVILTLHGSIEEKTN